MNKEISATSLIESISEFKPEKNISPPEKRRRHTGLSPMRMILLVICLGVFSYCVYSLSIIARDNLIASNLYGGMQSEFANILSLSYAQPSLSIPSKSGTLSSSASVPSKGQNFNVIESNETSQKFQQALSKLEKLNATNPDIVGYISVSGTGINYPILQGEDNDYYLTHSADKKYSKPGSIYYDFRCNPTPNLNSNLIVYGHNMKNGSMFHGFELMLDNEALFRESEVTIYSFEGIYTFKIFSIYNTNAYSDYLRFYFSGPEDYKTWLLKRAELSKFKFDVKLDENSRIISLSTCLNYPSDERVAVHGVLVNVEK